jgi:hypothetical protein
MSLAADERCGVFSAVYCTVCLLQLALARRGPVVLGHLLDGLADLCGPVSGMRPHAVRWLLTLSTVRTTHSAPSSVQSHCWPAPCAAGAALSRPQMWLVTCGPTPPCARSAATATRLVRRRPTSHAGSCSGAAANEAGGEKSGPYSPSMMKTGRSGCDLPRILTSLALCGV